MRRSFIFKVAGFQLSTCNLVKRDTPAQAFSCKFGTFLKKFFLIDYLWANASAGLIRILEK